VTASQSDCIFCKIASGDLGVPFVHESAGTVAFLDQAPQAREHILVVPKQHIVSVDELTRENDELLGELFETARRAAVLRNMNASGYRIVTNVGPDAGQTVFHMHLHVVGGEPLGHFGK
jgi:histidine triad (HIT) family protein